MLSSAVHTFTDPDDYAAKIRNTRAEVVVTERGEFTARITRIDLHRLWMQRFSDNLARVAHSAGTSGRVTISFRTQPGPSLLWGGTEMRLTNIVRHGEGESTFQRSSGSASWGAMSLPVADMVSVGAAMDGSDLAPQRDTQIVIPPLVAMAKLQGLHAAAGGLAEKAPEILANPDAVRGLEQALIEAMVGCLGHRQDRENSVAQGQHAIIMRAASAGWWRKTRKKRFTFQRSARRSGCRAGRCAWSARNIWEWGQSVTCYCAECIWCGGRCTRQRLALPQ